MPDERITPGSAWAFKPAKIAELLADRAMSFSELARQLGTSRTNIGAWLGGSHQPCMAHLCGLCNVFGVDPNEFFQAPEGWEATQ